MCQYVLLILWMFLLRCYYLLWEVENINGNLKNLDIRKHITDVDTTYRYMKSHSTVWMIWIHIPTVKILLLIDIKDTVTLVNKLLVIVCFHFLPPSTNFLRRCHISFRPFEKFKRDDDVLCNDVRQSQFFLYPDHNTMISKLNFS